MIAVRRFGVKVHQAMTISESIGTFKATCAVEWGTIVSARFGETEGTTKKTSAPLSHNSWTKGPLRKMSLREAR